MLSIVCFALRGYCGNPSWTHLGQSQPVAQQTEHHSHPAEHDAIPGISTLAVSNASSEHATRTIQPSSSSRGSSKGDNTHSSATTSSRSSHQQQAPNSPASSSSQPHKPPLHTAHFSTSAQKDPNQEPASQKSSLSRMAALHSQHPSSNIDPHLQSQTQHESSATPSRRSLFRATSGPSDNQVTEGSQDTATRTHFLTHPGSHSQSSDHDPQQQPSDLQRRATLSRSNDGDSSQNQSPNEAGGSSSKQRRSNDDSNTRKAVQAIQNPGSRSNLAVAGHDQLITWRIAAVAELADVEELLYEYGTRFRSFHITALLAKLPVIDTSGGNSGVRVREIVR